MAGTKTQIETARKAFRASTKPRNAAIRKSASLWYRWQELRKSAGLKHDLDDVAK
jgi:hypothetical protein